MNVIASICWRIALDPSGQDPQSIIGELVGVIPDNDLSELQTKVFRSEEARIYLTRRGRIKIIYNYLKRKYL